MAERESATKSVFARVVIRIVELYRQLYRQKHSVVQWTASDSTGRCKDQIKLILEVDQAKFEVSCLDGRSALRDAPGGVGRLHRAPGGRAGENGEGHNA